MPKRFSTLLNSAYKFYSRPIHKFYIYIYAPETLTKQRNKICDGKIRSHFLKIDTSIRIPNSTFLSRIEFYPSAGRKTKNR